MNINDLFQSAQGAEDTTQDFPDNLGPDELPHGTEVLCKIAWAQVKERPAKPAEDKGPAITFSTKLEVLEGEHAGGQFFDSIHLSGGDTSGNLTSGQESYNKRLFAKITAAGLDGNFFATNPSHEAIAKGLLGSKVRVKVQWQKPNAKGLVYLDNTTTWEPSDGSPTTGYVPSSKGF